MYCATCQSFVCTVAEIVATRSRNVAELQWSPCIRPKHKLIKEVKDASDIGCAICRNIRYTWSDSEWTRFKDDVEVSLELIVDGKVPLLKAVIPSPENNEPYQSRIVGMYLRETASGIPGTSLDIKTKLTLC